MNTRITRREFIKDSLKGSALAVACSATRGWGDAGTRRSPRLPASPRRPVAPSSRPPVSVSPREAMFYKQLDGVMIQCMLEPRECVVNNWERGYCGAKENRDGKYYTLVYSRPCAVYAEPIEREHFYHVYPGRQFLGIGTAGCNLECKFCETWHISQVRPEETTVQNLSPEDAVRFAVNKGCRMIAFTYNEPVICYEYTLETAKAAKQAGLTTLCHTAGYIYTEPLSTLLTASSITQVFACRQTLLRPPEPNLSAGMHDLNSGHGSGFNRRHWRSWWKMIPTQLMRYIHLNGIRAKMVERPEEYW